MMIHLGLPNWQYIFTDHGLSPEAKVTHIFNFTRVFLSPQTRISASRVTGSNSFKYAQHLRHKDFHFDQKEELQGIVSSNMYDSQN